MEELQGQEGAQLPNLPKRFQQALTRGVAAFNGGFTDAGIRLGNLLKVTGAFLMLESNFLLGAAKGTAAWPRFLCNRTSWRLCKNQVLLCHCSLL